MKKKLETENNEDIVNTKLKNMSDFEVARWYALIDAVNMIADMASQKRIDFSDVDIKPSAVEHYIESTCDIYCRKIQAENEITKQRAATKMAVDLINNIKSHENFVCSK